MTDRKALVEMGMKAGDVDMMDEDRIWSRYSGDKPDISRVLMEVIGHLHRKFPQSGPMRALSVGSGSEPQFQILQSAFQGGLFLLDIDEVPLADVRRLVEEKWIENVRTIRGDYCDLLCRPEKCRDLTAGELGGERVHLVTMHHSLYYSPVSRWNGIFLNLMEEVIHGGGAIHAVMMSASCDDEDSTTWLYDHFAGEFCGCANDQDLAAFGRELSRGPLAKRASVEVRTSDVRFFVDDFRKLMEVVWMILLYPEQNDYPDSQRRRITEHVYDRYWLPRRPLVQHQDHLLVFMR